MSCRHSFGAGILVCVFGDHLCFVQSNLWSNLWLRSLRGAPQITEFTVMGCPPLLWSDKISSSYLLPLLALRLLTTSVPLSFVLHSTSPARPSITVLYTKILSLRQRLGFSKTVKKHNTCSLVWWSGFSAEVYSLAVFHSTLQVPFFLAWNNCKWKREKLKENFVSVIKWSMH